MKELPCLEEIYDFETGQLEIILQEINNDLMNGGQCELPKGIESYEKFERKALKLKEHLELELDERKQVDNVINFFVNQNESDGIEYLNDEQFYKPVENQFDNFEEQKKDRQYQEQNVERDKSLANTARDSQSVFSTNEQSQLENESLAEKSEYSSVSQQMFQNRSKAMKNKKDMQQFMKDKLSKTKIASESVGSGSSMGPSQKNFTKKKTSSSAQLQEQETKPKRQSESSNSNIYKPNIRRNTSQSKSKPSKQVSNVRPQAQSKTTKESGKIKSEYNQVSGKEQKQSSSIYKPPLPTKIQNIENKKQNESQVTSQEQSIVNKEEVLTQVQQNNLEEENVNQEEILSKYSDHQEEQTICKEQIIDQESVSQSDEQQKTQVQQEKQKSITDSDITEVQEIQNDQSKTIIQETSNNQEQQEIEQEDQQEELDEDDGNESCEFYPQIEEAIENTQLKQLETEEKNKEYHQVHYISEGKDQDQETQNTEGILYNENQISNENTQIISQDTDNIIQQPIVKQSQVIQEMELQPCQVTKPQSKDEQALQKKPKSLMQIIKERDPEQAKQEQEERVLRIREGMQKAKEEKQSQLKQQQEQQINQSSSKENQEQKEIVQENDKKPEQNNKQTNHNKNGKKKQAQKAVSVPKYQLDGDCVVDYSSHYKSFYDIFVGQILDPKNFDINIVMREARNMYATFVNIMDSNALQMKKKHIFDQAPTEKSYQDYYKAIPNHFMLTGKNINDLELEMKNKGNEIMMQAMTQVELRDNFQKLKQKEVNDIIKEANQKAQSINSNNLIDVNRESSLYYRVIKNRSEVYDIISRAFSRKKRWDELPHGLDLRNSWNLLWTWSKIKIDITKLLAWQKCNHFSGAKNVSRKDFLKRNIERAQKMSQKAYNVFNILPLTFVLPKEYVGFLENFSEFEDKEGKLNYWIMKPAAKSRGRGIQMINDLSCVIYGEPIVIQRYIKNPLLVDGYKFDLRIYVLVTSVNPLEIFIYKEGFGRFSTMPYSLNPYDKANKYIHLTNVSIQKNNISNSEQNPTDLLYGGSKVSLKTLKQRVEETNGINWEEQIWHQIKEVVLKSLVACQNDMQYNPCCFELFGFDIMIDDQYKCWLIEINSSPSLSRETLLDDMIKQRLIDDSIDLLDPIDFDRKRLFDVLERRVNDDFKQPTSSNAFNKRTMNRDLTYILNGKLPRKFGEMPKLLGNYERIAPSPQCDQYLKLIGGQKMYGSLMKVNNNQNNTN